MSNKVVSCVLFAERHHSLAEAVRDLLATVATTVVMVADTESLLESAVRLQPQVAVVDLSLSRSGSVGWLSDLHARCPGTRVIVISAHAERSVRNAVLDAGADGFVPRSTIGTALLPAIELALV